MKSFVAIAAAVLVVPVLAAPTALPITKLAGPTRSDSYIIKLKDGISKDSHIARLLEAISGQDSKVVYKYENVFQGYAGVLKGPILDFVRRSSDVEYVQADTIYRIENNRGNRSPGSWGGGNPNPFNRATGEGVTVYGLDSGIYTGHSCFGGRASWGTTFGGYANADGNGHGTHTAATAVGAGHGPATAAKIVAVKVCSDTGDCAESDIIAGINYVASKARGPTVANLSIGGPASSGIDQAISNLINKGVHVTAAAGNFNVDATLASPARVTGVNTVGGIDRSNNKDPSSDYGSVVDVWALGMDVTSAWIGSPTATNTMSGTSMAAPAVAGILAVALSKYGSVSPSDLSSALKSHAAPVVKGVPSGTTNLKAQLW